MPANQSSRQKSQSVAERLPQQLARINAAKRKKLRNENIARLKKTAISATKPSVPIPFAWGRNRILIQKPPIHPKMGNNSSPWPALLIPARIQSLRPKSLRHKALPSVNRPMSKPPARSSQPQFLSTTTIAVGKKSRPKTRSRPTRSKSFSPAPFRVREEAVRLLSTTTTKASSSRSCVWA